MKNIENLIKKHEQTCLKEQCRGCLQNIKEYNPYRKCKVLLVFDDMITDK